MGLKREKVIITRKAQESIREYYNYIKRTASQESAHKVRKAILDKCKGLKDFSGYSEERYLKGDYRSVTQWDYNIIYTVAGNEVRILNVIHTSEHPDKRKNI